MQSRDFCYWLQGFFEISNPESIDKDQVEMIKRHLHMVFEHEIDPSMGSKEHQEELKQTHEKGKEKPKVPQRTQYPSHFPGEPRRIMC